MITTKLKTYKHVVLVFSLLLLVSCKTYLAPSYNQEIITKYTAAITSTFQYFAAIA